MVTIKIYDGKDVEEIMNACCKYYVGDIVYVVTKGKFGKMYVIKDRVSSISYDRIDFAYRTLHSGIYFTDHDPEIFDNEEDAMWYADRKLRRSKIKLIDETEV